MSHHLVHTSKRRIHSSQSHFSSCRSFHPPIPRAATDLWYGRISWLSISNRLGGGLGHSSVQYSLLYLFAVRARISDVNLPPHNVGSRHAAPSYHSIGFKLMHSNENGQGMAMIPFAARWRSKYLIGLWSLQNVLYHTYSSPKH